MNNSNNSEYIFLPRERHVQNQQVCRRKYWRHFLTGITFVFSTGWAIKTSVRRFMLEVLNHHNAFAGNLRISFIMIFLLLLAPIAYAAPLKIVNVKAPDINCKFDRDCRIIVNDSSDDFVLTGATGNAFLQSRTFPQGEDGTAAEGLFGYQYRIDLRKLTGTTAKPCIQSLAVDVAELTPLDYDDDQKPDDLYVVTSGGLGSIAPTSADQQGNKITFGFRKPVCAGSRSGGGDSTFFFGFASNNPHVSVTAQVTDTLGSITQLAARAPGGDNQQVVRVDCGKGDKIGDAVDRVQPGATILVTGRCTNESVTIERDGLVLEGQGQTVVDGGGPDNDVITVDGALGVAIRNLTVTNGYDGIVLVRGADVTLENIESKGNLNDGMYVERSSLSFVDSKSRSVTDIQNVFFNLLGIMNAYASSHCSDFNFSGNAGNGIHLNTGDFIPANNLRGCVNNNGTNGVRMTGTSRVDLNGSSQVTINNNGHNGLYVSSTSRFNLFGSSGLVTSNNIHDGIRVNSSSVLNFGSSGTRVTATGNQGFGVRLRNRTNARCNSGKPIRNLGRPRPLVVEIQQPQTPKCLE